MLKWTASRINVANYCRMRYYLQYVDPNKPKSLRLSAYVKGSLLHNLIEHFWDKLGTSEEFAKKSSGKKYYDTESFVKYSQGRWMRTIMAEKNSKNKIYWKDENEKWAIKSNLQKICTPLYDSLQKEGAPLFSELRFDFTLDGRRFYGIIDEIRKRNDKVVIRDYKSGWPWFGNMKINHDPQLTFYNLGLCALSYGNKKIAEKLGLEDKVIKRFMGNPIYINPDFEQEFFMIEALSIDKNNPKIKSVPQVILPTKRKDEHYFELIKMIDGTYNAIARGDVYPERGKKCDICDMKIECEKKLDDVNKGNLVGKYGQLSFALFNPDFLKNDYNAKKEKIPKQKRFSFRKTSLESKK